MKIFILSDLFPPYYTGGYELRCAETAAELAQRGHAVTVLTSWWGLKQGQVDQNVYRLLALNPTINMQHTANISDPLRLKRRKNQLHWAFQCRKNFRTARALMQKVQPDIVFIWNMEHVGINAILAAQDLGIPTVYTLGIDWLVKIKKELSLEPNPLKRKLRAMLNGLADFGALDTSRMIAISQALKKNYVENGFPEKSITVIPRGVPSNIILDDCNPKAGSGTNLIRLLFVGRVCPEKAPDDAIKAIGLLGGRVGSRAVALDIIGTGSEEYMQELRRLVANLRLEDQVHFRGWMEHQEILNRYADYDALVFPSRWEEPLGVVLLEAMARGVPVIATDRGGAPEVISDNTNGVIIQANHPEQLAEAINHLFLTDGLVQRLRLAALNIIQQKFTLARIVDRYMAYFDSVLERSI